MLERANEVREIFLVYILFEIPKDKAEYCSLGAAWRMSRGGRDVQM